MIETKNLSFRYPNQQAVKNVSLSVPANSIYGFLGPNGAGKSTTIRLLLGLLPSQSGSITLLEAPISYYKTPPLEKIGILIEAPAFYGHLSAYSNLSLLCSLRKLPRSRIDEVLNLVSLSKASKKKVRKFSMGMKQRLGLAAALLPDPELLILDEPTNGLDPQGMKEMRELLLYLNKEEGKTIFVSSHLLSEIELLATHLGIIENGTLKYQGSLSTLQSNKGGTKIILTGADTATPKILDTIYGVRHVEQTNSNTLTLTLQDDFDITALKHELLRLDIIYNEIYTKKESLESIYLKVTKSNII
jgi:ABC-2 type transport system ATP-binding protein